MYFFLGYIDVAIDSLPATITIKMTLKIGRYGKEMAFMVGEWGEEKKMQQ